VRSWLDRQTELVIGTGVVLVAIYFALPLTSQFVLYGIVGTAAALLIAYGVRRNSPSPAWPWLLFALGTALFSLGDNVTDAMGGSPPVPSWADAAYLAGYPALVFGLLYLLFAAGAHRRLAALADAGIVSFAFGLVQWVFVLDALVDDKTLGAGERAVYVAYPVMDVLILAGLAGFFVSAAWRCASFWLLVGSVVLLLMSDEVVALGSYSTGSWPDAGWLLSYTLWAAAAVHPSMRELSEPLRPYRRLRISSWRIASLLGALLTAPAVLLIQKMRELPPPVVPAIIGGTTISVLVILRLLGILRALEVIRVRERVARADAEQAQRLLEAQNERLREADRMKDEFVALISHDLRTPLTSIMGYIELTLDEQLEPDTRSYLEVVSRSSQRLLRLVDDLLFVARLQSGRLELMPTRLDLNEVAEQAAQEARARAEAKDLRLVVQRDGPVQVEADRGRVFQLLDNLVSNAIKFTPDGGTVEIRVGGGDAAVLEVCDTGMGFSEAEAARVFERFYRTETAVERQVPGTGLGLFIAYAITDAHGGRISAHPRDGGGAVFRVELPLAESTA
jgi:signal transduction histidine kinase